MAEKTGPGFQDVLDRALEDWEFTGPRAPSFAPLPQFFFGAAGTRGFGPDPELTDLVWKRPGKTSGNEYSSRDPMRRLFGCETGRQALSAVGNERRTLAAVERLSVEIMAEALRLTGQARDTDRLLVIPGQLGGDLYEPGRPPVLMLMSPRVTDVSKSRLVSGEMDLPVAVLQKGLSQAADPNENTPEAAALRQVLSGGPEALAEVFMISQPEILLTRRPRMIPLCVPSPHMKIESGEKISTAGVFCRDADDDLGVTGCFHGTGPVGTKVNVGLRECRVKHASEVQDLVFIPLGKGYDMARIAGLGGVRDDREPARADHVRFDGAVNQNRETRIFSTDTGLLRARPTIMLKLQTDPDTDQGDSGSALLDEHDKVLGFAFERTAYDDYPQFTDWIWASNALRALGLTAHKAGE